MLVIKCFCALYKKPWSTLKDWQNKVPPTSLKVCLFCFDRKLYILEGGGEFKEKCLRALYGSKNKNAVSDSIVSIEIPCKW